VCHTSAGATVTDQAEHLSHIRRSRVTDQVVPLRQASPGTAHQMSGSPGNRTLNLRIKSLLPRDPVTCAFAKEGRQTRNSGRWSFRVVASCFRLARGFFAGFFEGWESCRRPLT
jgi:hypothetical protein